MRSQFQKRSMLNWDAWGSLGHIWWKMDVFASEVWIYNRYVQKYSNIIFSGYKCVPWWPKVITFNIFDPKKNYFTIKHSCNHVRKSYYLNKCKKKLKIFFVTKKDVDSVSGWLAENKLTKKVRKCEVMFLASGNPEELKLQEKVWNTRILINIWVYTSTNGINWTNISIMSRRNIKFLWFELQY